MRGGLPSCVCLVAGHLGAVLFFPPPPFALCHPSLNPTLIPYSSCFPLKLYYSCEDTLVSAVAMGTRFTWVFLHLRVA